ncbi:MAG: guanylate kinase [Muribaculaceae bacterium]|nr:guanylate kinase [Muribaculaceae bacterium]MCM1478538.1 guanylate kinase [Muribaculaceae bacterium]
MNKGMLIVVSGPSGCGKGTVLAEILKSDKVFYSVSATTRSPRPGETDGVNYYFLTKDKFEKLIDEDGMLEYAKYCGNYYGTPKKPVEDMLEQGKHVILEIEVQGAMKIMEKRPEAVFVFILPPSLKELERRLKKRGTEAEDVVKKRLNEAAGEIKQAYRYNYAVINGELEKAVDDLKAIIRAEELKTINSKNNIDEVLENA